MKTTLISPSSELLPERPSPEGGTTNSGGAASLAPVSSPGAPQRAPGPGRPTALNERMLDVLCAIIRDTGASDSAAAARAGLHPSTVSRWKQEKPDVAILLRSAREEFRVGMFGIIQEEARAGRATSWRAATWVLERVFPEEFSPRARERAMFQEQYEAACAREGEGGEVTLPDRGEPLENVKKSPSPALETEPSLGLPAGRAAAADGLAGMPLPERPLQNVKNPALAGPVRPPALSAGAAETLGTWCKMPAPVQNPLPLSKWTNSATLSPKNPANLFGKFGK